MNKTNPYTKPESYNSLFMLVGSLITIAWVGVKMGETDRESAWLLILILIGVFTVTLGKGITGSWRGILIDNRNKISLSRLQMISWTAIVLSSILTTSLSNVLFGWDSPLDFNIPPELWIAMGISTVSLVASPAILGSKQEEGVVVSNVEFGQARWSDLVLGEESGNYTHVDLGKLQMLLISFVLLVSYGAALWSMFSEPGVITALPQVADGMNVLLGISHTGYLSSKVMSNTHKSAQPLEDRKN